MLKLLTSVQDHLSTLEAVAKEFPIARIRGLNPSEKEKIHTWIKSIAEVKASADAPEEKKRKLEDLATPALVMDILKSHVAALVENKSVSQKSAHTVMDGLAKLISFRTFFALNAVGFGVNKLIAKFIISPASDEFLKKVEEAVTAEKATD